VTKQILEFPSFLYLHIWCMLFLSCGPDGSRQVSNQFPPIAMKLTIQNFDRENLIFVAQLFVRALTDTVKVEKMEILHPTFVCPIEGVSKEAIVLLKGQLDTLSTGFEILQRASFKLKAVVYGSYYRGRLKISNVCYAYFFFDGERYLTGYESSDMLGKEKKDGSKISTDDLRVFDEMRHSDSLNCRYEIIGKSPFAQDKTKIIESAFNFIRQENQTYPSHPDIQLGGKIYEYYNLNDSLLGYIIDIRSDSLSGYVTLNSDAQEIGKAYYNYSISSKLCEICRKAEIKINDLEKDIISGNSRLILLGDQGLCLELPESLVFKYEFSTIRLSDLRPIRLSDFIGKSKARVE
jgi:hypothetical protein